MKFSAAQVVRLQIIEPQCKNEGSQRCCPYHENDRINHREKREGVGVDATPFPGGSNRANGAPSMKYDRNKPVIVRRFKTSPCTLN